jgi:hypothetical protein
MYIHTAHLQCKGFKAHYLCEAKLYLFYFKEKNQVCTVLSRGHELLSRF